MVSAIPDGYTVDNRPPIHLYESSRRAQILTMVLTAVNIFAAAVMAGIILWDTRVAYVKRRRGIRRYAVAGFVEKGGEQKEDDAGGGGGLGLNLEPGTSASESSQRLTDGGGADTRAWWQMVPSIDLFPLILAVTIFVQGIMLAVVEGEGLKTTLSRGNCRYTSEVAWVALWITPYIVLSFTIEATIRALSQPRFQPRSGKAVLYCVVFALVLTLLTWIPSRVMPENTEQDICNGQLMSFVDQFAAGGLGLMSALLPIAIFMSVVVIMHLNMSKDVVVDGAEKIATSRTICFLIINILQWILMVPNYALTAQNQPRHSASELATVVANIGGIVAFSLYLYLRAQIGQGDQGEKGPSVVCPGTPAEGENEQYQDGDHHAAVSSIIDEYSDPPAVPAPATVLLPRLSSAPATPQTPRSPTSIYSRGHRSSRAPSLFSQYTTHSFKRLGEEITNMISGLRAAEASKRLPVLPTSQKPATNYTIFPPTPDRQRPPTRPSRATTPTINMDRRQPNPKLGLVEPERRKVARSASQKNSIPIRPFGIVRSASQRSSPARPFEVAIPPRVDSGDAESFMEILIWKKDNPIEAGCV